MIPALILYLIKRMKYGSSASTDFKKFREIALKIKSVFFFLILSICFSFHTLNATERITYKVVKNNTTIGYICIERKTSKNVTTYTSKSDIQAKFLVTVSVTCAEKSVFKNGVLVYSSVFRKINEKVKVNHKLERRENQYVLIKNNQEQLMEMEELYQNLITLYFEEPKAINKVYCDNLKHEVAVKPLNNGCYRVDFEKGKYNIFYYKEGKCIKIDAFSKMFDVTLIPVMS